MRRGKKGKRLYKRAVAEINYLLDLAFEKALEGDLELSRRYVEHAIVFSMKTNTRIPRHRKRQICKKCHTLLIPGRTARVRLNSRGGQSFISIKCLVCGHIKRIVYKKKGIKR